MTQPKQPQEWEGTQDFKNAVMWANEFLDEPNADPDDEIRTISRQFLRQIERVDHAYRLGQEDMKKRALEALPEEPKDSPYVRNHSMPSHGGTTLTNAFRKGFKDSLHLIRTALSSLEIKQNE